MTVRRILFLDRLGLDSHYYHHFGSGRSLFDTSELDVTLLTSSRGAERSRDSLHLLNHMEIVDDFGMKSLTQTVRKLAQSHIRFDRVVALTERLLVGAAHLREVLGCPGLTVDEVDVFRDKISMKERLALQGVRVPDFASYSRATAHDLLNRYGHVVIKPRLGAGARDVYHALGKTDLDQFECAAAGLFSEFEVEEFISGELFHIDSVVHDGRVIAATVGHSQHPPTVYASGPHYLDFEVIDHGLRRELLDFNARAIACFNGFSGVTHLEAFKSISGEIVFCEVAGRWGGGGIRPSFYHRTGLDLVAVMLAAELGQNLSSLQPKWSNDLTGYGMFYRGGKTLARPFVAEHPQLIERYLRAELGTPMPHPQSWEQAAAVLTVRGDTVEQLRDALADLERHLDDCCDAR